MKREKKFFDSKWKKVTAVVGVTVIISLGLWATHKYILKDVDPDWVKPYLSGDFFNEENFLSGDEPREDDLPKAPELQTIEESKFEFNSETKTISFSEDIDLDGGSFLVSTNPDGPQEGDEWIVIGEDDTYEIEHLEDEVQKVYVYYMADIVSTITEFNSNANVYTITSYDEFITFRERINFDGVSYSGKIVALLADIERAGSVGTANTPFAGTFDGGGHTMTFRYNHSSSVSYNGVFTRVSNATIRNLRVTGMQMTVNDGSLQYTGGIVAYGSGTITDCVYETPILGTGIYVGGIAGCFSGTIQYCKNLANIAGDRYVGGIVGNADGALTIYNCENTGEIVCATSFAGGIAGNAAAAINISYCVNEGACTLTDGNSLGGILGYSPDNTSTISHCKNIGAISGYGYIGGILGRGTGTDLSYCVNTGSITPTTTTNNAATAGYIGGICGLMNNDGAKITKCHNRGDITGSKNYVGGIIGQAKSSDVVATISDCGNYATVRGGRYVGGIVGHTDSNIQVTMVYSCGGINASNGLSAGIIGTTTVTRPSNINYCYVSGVIQAPTYGSTNYYRAAGILNIQSSSASSASYAKITDYKVSTVSACRWTFAAWVAPTSSTCAYGVTTRTAGTISNYIIDDQYSQNGNGTGSVLRWEVPPTLLQNPFNVLKPYGTQATLDLEVYGATNAMTYQWYKATSESGTGSPISGATSSSYTVTVDSTDYWYYCIVTGVNSAGSAATATTARAKVGRGDYVVDINKTEITASLGTTSYTYDGNAKQPTVTVKDGSKTLTLNTDYTVSYSNNTNAGTATATITGIGKYYKTRTLNFTINRAAISVPTVAAKTYNGSAQTGLSTTTTYTAGGTTSATDAGTYTATATPTANYKWSDGTTTAKNVSWTINPKSVAVNWGTTVSFVYNGSAQAPTASASSGVTGETINITRTTATNVGSYTSTASISSVSGGRAKAGNYTLTGTTKAFEITRAAISVPTVAAKTYNGSTQTGLSTTTTYTAGGTTSGIDAGTYTATATPTANYKWSDGTTTAKDVSWTINPKSVAVSWGTTVSFVYNGSAQAPTASASSGVTGETINITRTTATNVGSYTSTASISSVTGGRARAANYTLTGTTKAFEITRKGIAIPSVTNRTYNGSAQTGLTAGTGYTVGGTTSATNAGTYYATATPTSNYKWNDNTTETKTLTWYIYKANKSITLAETSKTLTYGTNGTVTFTHTGEDTIPTVSSNATGVATATVTDATKGGTVTITPKGAGSAALTVTAPETPNYNAATATISVTVNRATGTMTVTPTSLSLGSNTGTITYTYNGNATPTASSNATGVATVSINTTSKTVTVTPVATGSATVTISAAQTNQYTAVSKTVSVAVDKTPPGAPTLTAKLNNSSGATYTSGSWTNQNVFVKATATDANGISKYQYQIGSTSGTWTDITTGEVTFDVDRNATIYFRAVDNYSNYSSASSIIVRRDTVKPTVTVESDNYTEGSWTGNDVTFKITATDSASGVMNMHYSKDGRTYHSLLVNTANNLLYNSDFKKTYTVNHAWDTSKNENTAANSWSEGYNGGVSNPTVGYHAHISTKDFAYPVLKFPNKNSEIGITGRWLGFAQGISAGTIKANTTYTISYDVYSATAGTAINTGIYHRTTANGETYNFYSGTVTNTVGANETGKWVRKSHTFTTTSNFDTAYSSNLYIYGHYGVEGIIYVKDVKLEEGTSATTWTPHASERTSASKTAILDVGSHNGNIYFQVADGANNFTTVTKTVKIDKGAPEVTITNNGTALYTDPTFASGNNSTSVYNNNGNGTVTITRRADSTVPTDSGYALHIKTVGAANPNHGGFYFANSTAANEIHITKIVAKIPVGYTINWHSNAVGTGSSSRWLTSQAGTGNWETYIFYLRTGSTGSFSTTNFFALSGGSTATASAPVEWDVAYANVYKNTLMSWTNQNVTVTGSMKDSLTGVTGYAFTTTQTQPTSWTSVSATTNTVTGTTTASANGTYYLWTKDAVGNIGMTATYIERIDKTAPKITSITKSPSGYTTGNVQLLFNATDEASGVASYATSPWDYDHCTSYTAITPALTVTNQLFTTYSYNRSGVYLQIKDQAGNIAQAFSSVSNIDKTAPKFVDGTSHTAQEYYNNASKGTALDTGTGFSSAPSTYQGGSTTLTSVNDGTVNSSNVLKVTHAAGTTRSGYDKSKYYDTSKVYVRKITAKIPSGYTLYITGNTATGDITNITTSFAGTGAWKEYSYVYVMSDTAANTMNYGHAYIEGSAPGSAFDWYVSSDITYDVTHIFDNTKVTYSGVNAILNIEAKDTQSGVSSITVNNAAQSLTTSGTSKKVDYTVSSAGTYTLKATDAVGNAHSITKTAYTIAYNGNGATGGSTATQIKIDGANRAVSSNGFSRTNYVFERWNTKADATGTNYEVGAAYSGNESITLYAKWRFEMVWDISKTAGTDNVKAYLNEDPNNAGKYILTIKGTGAMKDFADYPNVPWVDHRTSISKLVIEEGVTSVGDRAFYNFTGITEIKLPSTMKYIGTYSFYSCSRITGTITIPKGVTSVGTNPFLTVPVTAINVETGNTAYKTSNGVLYNYAGTQLISYPYGKTDTSYTVLSTTTSINTYACYGMRATSITLPAGLTTINSCAFQTSNLNSIIIPSSVTSIGGSAFNSAASLATVYVESTSLSLGSGAFTSLKSGSVIYTISKGMAGKYTSGTIYTAANTTIYYPPLVTAKLEDRTAIFGNKATFTVTAENGVPTGITYQWQYRTSSTGTWSNVTSSQGTATNGSFTTVDTTMAMSGYQYRCILSSSVYPNSVMSQEELAGSLISNAATLTVSRANRTITMNGTMQVTYGANGTLNFSYTGEDVTATAVSSNTNAATIKVNDGDKGGSITVTPLAYGTTTITLTIPQSTSYNEQTATCIVSVLRAEGHVTLSDLTGEIPYKTTSKTFTVTSHHGGELSVEQTTNTAASASISGTTVTIANTGNLTAETKVTIKVTSGQTPQYNAASNSYTLTIIRANISPTVNMTGYTYAGTKSEPTVSGNPEIGKTTYYYNTENVASGGTPWANVTSSTYLNAGKYYMYAIVEATANYNGATTPTVAFTIAKATPVLTIAKETTRIVNGNSETISYSYNGDGGQTVSTSDRLKATATINTAVDNRTITITATGVGTATITISAAEGTNYLAKTASIVVNVPQSNYSIGTVMYETLNEAYNAITGASATIKVEKDNTDSSEFTNAKTIVLNMNGKTITKTDKAIINNGTLTITGSGTITTAMANNLIENSGILEVKDTAKITYTGTGSYYAINNGKTLTINTTGTISSTYRAILTSGSATINSGNITSGGDVGIRVNESGSVIVTGGTIIANIYGIYTDSTATKAITMTGGTINSNIYGIRIEKATQVDVTGGAININANIGADTHDPCGIHFAEAGTLNMSGNTIITVTNSGSGQGRGIEVNTGTANITGGTINAKTYGILNITSAIVNVSGTTTVNSDLAGLMIASTTTSAATVNVTEGTITGGSYGIWNNGAGKFVVGTKGGDVSTSAPVIKGEIYGYYGANENAVLEFYDGIFKGRQAGISDIGKVIPENGYGVSKGNEDVGGVIYQIATLAMTNYSVEGSYYATLADAYKAILGASGTIFVEATNTDSSELIIDSGKTITINIPENMIITKTSKGILNNGKLTITGNGSIRTAEEIILLETYGILNVEKEVTIESINRPIATFTNVEVNIKGGTIKATNNITDYISALYITGGATVNISGNTQIIANNTGEARGISITEGIVNMTGGSISAKTHGILNELAKINVSGSSNISGLRGLSNASTSTSDAIITVTGGTISGTEYGIWNSGAGKVVLGDDDGTIGTGSPVIVGEVYGYEASTDDVTFEFYDGVLKGKTDAYNSEDPKTPDGYGVSKYRVGDYMVATLSVKNYSVDGYYYETLEDSYNVITGASGKIIVEKDNTDSSTFEVDSGKTITIDTNTKTVTKTGGDIGLTNNGTLIIEGTGTIQTEEANTNTITDLIRNGGIVTVNNGTLWNKGKTGTGEFEWHVIGNFLGSLNGTINVNGGTLKTSLTEGVTSTGASRTIYLQNGTLNMTEGNIISDLSASMDGIAIHTFGNMTGKINISGGTVKSNTLAIANGATTGVTNSTVINITGGTVEGGHSGIINYAECAGSIVVSGGTVKGNIEEAIDNKGSSKVIIGNSSDIVTNDTPVIEGITYGISSSNGFEFYDGILKGKTEAYSGAVIKVADGYGIHYSTEGDYKTALLRPYLMERDIFFSEYIAPEQLQAHQYGNATEQRTYNYYALGAYRAETDKLISNKNDYTSDKITGITIIEKLSEAPTTYEETWDVSSIKDGSVQAWLVKVGTEQYHLYIGSNGKILAPSYSSSLFALYNNATEISGLSNLDTRYVTTMNSMFYGCRKVIELDISTFNTDNLIISAWVFAQCKSLEDLEIRNDFITNKATSLTGMFSRCNSLATLDVSKYDTSNVTDMSYIFRECTTLTTLNVTNWNTGKVANMNDMFNGCSKLTTLDVSKWNTESVTNMACMFSGCNDLATLNVTDWNTGKVTNMTAMFYACRTLETLGISKWNTANVTNMQSMFNACSSLTEIDVSNFVTSKVTTMAYMFNYCNRLETINAGNFNTSNVTDMLAMFANCSNLKNVNVSGFNTSKVKSMGVMFKNCTSLTSLDLSSFNLSGLDGVTGNHSTDENGITFINNNGMLYGCTKLKSVLLGNNFGRINGTNMFKGCTNLTAIIAQATTPLTLSTDTGVKSMSDTILYVPSLAVEHNYEKATNYASEFGDERIRPILEIVGDNPYIIHVEEEYKDPGATVAGFDVAEDFEVYGYKLKVDGANIDTITAGFKIVTYTLTYTDNKVSPANTITIMRLERDVEIYDDAVITGLFINNGAKNTKNVDVILQINATNTDYMYISNSEVAPQDDDWIPYTKYIKHQLVTGNGNKTIYVWCKNEHGDIVTEMSAVINLDASYVLRLTNNQTYTGRTDLYSYSVQYALKAEDGEYTPWQDSNTFEGLIPNTIYYAKTKIQDTYGLVQESHEVKFRAVYNENRVLVLEKL